MRRVHRPVEVEVHNPVPVLELHVEEVLLGHDGRTGDIAAGDIDEDVDPPVTGHDQVGDGLKRFGVHDITGKGHRFRTKLCSDGFHLFRPMHQADDPGSLRGKMAGQRAAQHAGGPRDDGYFPLDRVHFIHYQSFLSSFSTAAIMPLTWPKANIRP